MSTWPWAAAAAIVGVVGYAGFSAASNAQSTVDVPRSTVVERVVANTRPLVGTGFGHLTLRAIPLSDTAIEVSVNRAGESRNFRCPVRVEADGDTSTVIETQCLTNLPSDTPQARTAARAMGVIIREHVLAAAEQRAYDMEMVNERVMAIIVR